MNGKMLMKHQDSLGITHLVLGIVVMVDILIKDMKNGLSLLNIKDLFGDMLKRFQYYSNKGIVWSDWFKWESTLKPKYQLDKHPKLLNEYKEL